jgi:hypothetical protein
MRRTLPAGVAAFLLAACGIASAAPGQSAGATFTVSVEVIRPCTVRTGGGGSIDCHGQTPSTMRLTTTPAPGALTTTSPQSSSETEVLTILF